MSLLALEHARRIADEALNSARRKNFAPLAVVVLDVRGCQKASLSEDGTSLLRTDIALSKAWGALGMGMGGRSLARRAAQNPGFFQSLNSVSQGLMVAVPGSVLIRSKNGELLGAIGISGDTSDNDEQCAVEAIESVGFIADVGE